MTDITPYEMAVRINSYQTDTRSRLSLTSLFQLFQEAAYRHAEELGWGWEVLRSKNQFWALTRVAMEIERMPLWNEELIVRTAPRMGEGIMAPRDLLLLDGEGNCCVKSTTFWVIMDITERRPVPPRGFFSGLSFSPACDMANLTFRKMRGEFQDEALYSRKVYHSSLDMNHHVNNASYVNLLLDALPDGGQDLEIKGFQIAFQQEAVVGDILTVYEGKDKEGALLLRVSEESGEKPREIVTARII